MEKISAVYKITNTVTGDFYIGSSKNVKRRWESHKWQSTWNNNPNKQLYQDMQKFGVDKFVFEILAEVEAEKLKETEQQFIEALKPNYNDRNANGIDIERCKEYQKEYNKEYNKEYQKTDEYKKYQKEYQKEYEKTNKRKKYKKEYNKKYRNQLCCYNGETLTLHALYIRFRRKGIPHPVIEAKKYLLQ